MKHDYRTFIVPYDFSDHSRTALEAARDLATRLSADLHLVHVIQTPLYAYPGPAGGEMAPIDLTQLEAEASRSLDEVAAQLEGASAKVEAHVLQGASVPAGICEFASQLHADLIVMGTHGRTGLAHVFLGSVAERTLRTAPCPVLTVRAAQEK